MMIRIACHRLSVKSPIASSTVTAWSATRIGLDADRQAGADLIHRRLDVAAKGEDVAATRAWRWRGRSPAWPLTRNIGCGGSAVPRRTSAMSPRRKMRSPTTKLTLRMSCSLAKAPETRTARRSCPVSISPDGAHQVLRLQRREQRAVVQAEAGKAFGREFDEDALVLRAEDLDLRDIGHQQQARARGLDVVAQFALGEAVGGEAVDDAEGVAEIIVEERARARLAAACGACRRRVGAPGTTCPAPRVAGVAPFRSTKIVVWPGTV